MTDREGQYGGEVLYEMAGRVATATINRPEQRNSLNVAAITGLARAVAAAKQDPDVRVLVVTGAGKKAFCAGADLSTMFADGDPGEGKPGVVASHHARGALARLFLDLWDLGKPTIAKVRGYALAGGFGLAMACDLVVAAEDARFGTPEINVGLWPYMSTVPILRSMTPRAALELMMTGRRVEATEAREMGLVNRVVPVDELDGAVAELAGELAGKSPQAMQLGRGSFYRALSMGPAEALDYLQAMLSVTTMSEDAAEGIAAFIEKRPPIYGPG